MRLLYCLPFWPYLYTPWLFREMRWMREHDHHVAVITLADPPGDPADLRDYGLEDVPVLHVRQRYSGDVGLVRQVVSALPHARQPCDSSLRDSLRDGGVRQGLIDWATRKQVLAFVRRQGVDVIEAHWATDGAELARRISAITGIGYAVRMHGGDLCRSPSPNLPRIVAEAAAVCPVSRFLADLLAGERPLDSLPIMPRIDLDPTRLRVCHHGLPDDAIATTPPPQDPPLTILSVGRLDPEKRQSDVLEAAAPLLKRGDVRLRLAGGGQLEPALREQARRLGVAERFEITGGLPWAEVIGQLRSASVYTQASELEGFSLSAIEGLAQGLPVALSRTGASYAQVEEGVNGYTFTPHDVAGLRDALSRIVDSTPDERAAMGEASLRIARERFRTDTLMQRLERILLAVRDGTPLPE